MTNTSRRSIVGNKTYKYIVALYYKDCLYQKAVKVTLSHPDWRYAVVAAIEAIIIDNDPVSYYKQHQTDLQQDKLCKLIRALPSDTVDTDYILLYTTLPDDPNLKWKVSYIGEEE